MTDAQPPEPQTPFKGLAAFDDSDLDALLFFGREHDAEVVRANLLASRLTILHGPTGVGKSSVLRAGVAHPLRHDPHALVVVIASWSGDPLQELFDALEAEAAALEPETEPIKAGSLADALGAWSARLDRYVYVVLDQFEEFFLYRSPDEPFIVEVAAAIRRRGLRANFLLGIRDDALAQLDSLSPRLPGLFANPLGLERLDRRAGEQAITGPIGAYNALVPPERHVEIEPELIDAVLTEVAIGRVDLGLSGRGGVDGAADRDRIEAPYLQLVLERLWEAESSPGPRRLSLATLRELGGAERIVEEHVAHAMSDLSAADRDAAAEIYNYLVTPSGTKIAHRASDLAGYVAIPEADVTRVLDRLSSERIIRAGENGASGPRYEIFHDVLADAVLAWRTRHQADRELAAERAAAARRQRRLLVVGAVASAVIAVLAAATIYALWQRSDARSEARKAQARELAARAATELSADPVRGVRLAARAAQLEASPQTEDMLRTALRGLRLDALFHFQAPVVTSGFSPDGRLLVAAGGDEARVFTVHGHRLVRTLKHGAPITGTWFNPSGKTVLTAGDDGTAKVWDVATGRPLYRLQHQAPINAATFSADGRLVATASNDGTARIWRATNGRLLHLLRHPRSVTTVAFGARSTLLATAASDRIGRVFDVATGRLVARLVQRGTVSDIAFAGHGPTVATAGADKIARIWNGSSGKLRFALRGHFSRVLDVEFDPRGERLVTASADQSARVWDARTGQLVATLLGDTNQILHARFSPDGKSVVTASSDRTARVFDATGALRSVLAGHRDTVTDAVFSPDGEAVATASADDTAGLWNWRSSPYLQLVGNHHRGRVVAIDFSRDGRRLLSAAADGGISIWRLRGRPVAVFGKPAAVTSASFGKGDVVTTDVDGVARLWVSGHLARVFRGPPRVRVAALAPDGRTIATANAAGTVQLWSVSGGMRHALHGGRVTVLTFSPDGNDLVTAGTDSVARIWRVDDGKLLHELRGHRGGIAAVSFSPDGRRLVTAGFDRTARLWDVATGDLVHVLRGHKDLLTSASFSPDGKRVVTTSNDRDARVWDAASGHGIAVLRVHYGRATDAAFTADGRWVATTGGGGVGVFNPTTGRILYLLRTRDVLPLEVATSPHGWRIAAGGTDGYVESFDCRLCADVNQLLALASKRLAQLEATS